MADVFRTQIVASIQEAEEAVKKWRNVLDAYDEAVAQSQLLKMRRRRFPNVPELVLEPTSPQRQSVGPEIVAAVNSFPEGQEFTLKDVFKRFPNKTLDYGKSRPSISIWLAERERAGDLTKIRRGVYVKLKSK